MAFADWNSGDSLSSAKPHHGFVCMSTVDDLSYTPSEKERSRDAAQIAATGRRSWKTLKGKGEAVWPPLLEAALIEALEKYQPDCSRSHKILGRFPMRNRFISDYVYETTGKRRTPKQVGSRLQQLRDTCKEERILHLICRRHSGDLESFSSSSENGARDASHTPPPSYSSDNSGHRRLVVYMDIPLELPSYSSPRPVVPFVTNEIGQPFSLRLPAVHLSSSPSAPSHHTLYHPGNVLPMLSRTVEFTSPWQLALQSVFTVYRGGSDLPVHTEVVPLQLCSSSPLGSSWQYTSELAPHFWDNLCRSRDPTKYTLLQNMTPIAQDSVSTPSMKRRSQPSSTSDANMISIVYYFSFPEDSSAPMQPTSPLSYIGQVSEPEQGFVVNNESTLAIDQRCWNAQNGDYAWSEYRRPFSTEGCIDPQYDYSPPTSAPRLDQEYSTSSHSAQFQRVASPRYEMLTSGPTNGAEAWHSWPNGETCAPPLANVLHYGSAYYSG